MPRDQCSRRSSRSAPRSDVHFGPGHSEGGHASRMASFSDCPVFLLDGEGNVLFANLQGRSLLDHGSVEARTSLTAAIRCGCSPSPWLVTALQDDDQAKVFLAVFSSEAAAAPAFDAVEAATVAWKLTPKQRQVLDVVSRGLTNLDTGRLLGIAEATVEYHLAHIFDKAGVENRAMLISRLLDL
jgi:DNA-binding CsgD family transcriptional regulator